MKVKDILLAALLILAGCSQQTETSLGGGQVDPSRQAQVTLSAIGVEGSTATASGGSDASTRAERTILPLPVGQTFRLYAFAKGETDINKVISTRTYTIGATAGTPVMDAGQKDLYLPLGNVDIYLVGPVRADLNAGKTNQSGNPLSPQMVDVAATYGVFPQHGVDLIASKTEIVVKPNNANTIAAATLSHKMAKMEVVVQRPDLATYQNLKVNVIQLKNQSLTGEYTFGADGGAVTPADEGDATFEPTVIEQEAGKTYLIRELMIPRKEVYMKVGVFFTCYISETEQVSRRMESGTLKYALVAGQNNRFETRPNISTDLLFRYRLLPWEEVTMPEQGIHPNADVLFSYSGADAPIERGGKRYWIDRSGNGRDAELVGNVKYNATEKYYYTTDARGYIRIPNLGLVPVYTFEMMATSEYAAKGTPADFFSENGALSLRINFPRETSNQIAYYTTSVGTTQNVCPNDKAYLENIATWAFAKNLNEMSIRRNGVVCGTPQAVTANQAHGSFFNNTLLSWSTSYTDWNSGKIKLYGARMSSTYLTNDALKQNHRNDMMTLKDVDPSQGYIQDGLILDLQGEVAPATVDGRKVWTDRSVMKNHAEIIASNGTVTHVPAEKCYQLVGSGTCKYMKMIKSLGTMQSLTVEVVMQFADRNSYQTLVAFSSVDNQAGMRELFIHYPYGGSMYVNSPWNNDRGGINQAMGYINNFPYSSVGGTHQLSITRKENTNPGINVRSGGVQIINGVGTYTPLNEMKACYIGCHPNGYEPLRDAKIYAIRVYNRVLTDAERQVNYQVDKEKYNLHN